MAGHRSKEEIRKQWLDKVHESNFKYMDVIISSGRIRRLFFERCKDLNIDPFRLAMKHNISFNAFSTNYVKSEAPQCTKSFNQEDFLKMCEDIGLEIKVLVSMKPLEEIYVRLQKEGLIKDKKTKDDQ